MISLQGYFAGYRDGYGRAHRLLARGPSYQQGYTEGRQDRGNGIAPVVGPHITSVSDRQYRRVADRVLVWMRATVCRRYPDAEGWMVTASYQMQLLALQWVLSGEVSPPTRDATARQMATGCTPDRIAG